MFYLKLNTNMQNTLFRILGFQLILVAGNN